MFLQNKIPKLCTIHTNSLVFNILEWFKYWFYSLFERRSHQKNVPNHEFSKKINDKFQQLLLNLCQFNTSSKPSPLQMDFSNLYTMEQIRCLKHAYLYIMFLLCSYYVPSAEWQLKRHSFLQQSWSMVFLDWFPLLSTGKPKSDHFHINWVIWIWSKLL